MSNDIATVPEYYVITGISTETGHAKTNERVYVGTDSQSGYPYWATFFNSANKYTDIEKALRAYNEATSGYMLDQAAEARIGVVRITIDLQDIDDSKIVEDRKQAALKKLSSGERRLLGL